MNKTLSLPQMKYFIVVALVSVLTACASSGPATSFYSFFPSDSITNQSGDASGTFSLGVGPVELPEYLENPAVVSLSDGPRLRVSGYHAWAGSLKEAITRVVAEDLSRAFPSARIDAFPWDNRVRPDYQLRLNINQFAGVRGGEITVNIAWTLLNQRGDAIIASGKIARKTQSSSSEVEAYVKSLNQLLNEGVEALAESLSEYLK